MRIYYIANIRIPTKKAHGRTIMQFCDAAVAQGHDVTLVVPDRKNDEQEDPFVFYGVGERFSIKYLPTLDLFWAEKRIGKWAYWVQTFSFIFSVKLWLFVKSRAGTVCYTREWWALLFRWWGFTTVFECHVIPRRFQYVFGWCVRQAVLCVVISQSLGKTLRTLGAKNVHVEPSPVALDMFEPAIDRHVARERVGLPQNAFIVGYTGAFTTMNQDKGLRIMIEALTQLPDDVHVVAVGGSAHDHEHYSAYVNHRQAAQYITLLEFVPHQEVPWYHAAADVLAMPFPYTTHYAHHMSPIKMLEYMASDRPIIASDLPTIREVLDDDHAFLCKPDSVESFVAQVLAAKQQYEQAQKKAKKALLRVQRYGISARTQRILDAISTQTQNL